MATLLALRASWSRRFIRRQAFLVGTNPVGEDAIRLTFVPA
jgi:hypothetical protein